MKKFALFVLFCIFSMVLKAETQIQKDLLLTQSKTLSILQNCTVYGSMTSPCTGNVITIKYTSKVSCDDAYTVLIDRMEEIEDLASDAGCK